MTDASYIHARYAYQLYDFMSKLINFISKKDDTSEYHSCIISLFNSLLFLIQIRNIMIYILYIVNIVQ